MLEKSVVDERTAEDRQKQLESLNNRKSVLLTKRAELERRVRDLGTLPADAYEMHRDATTEQLHSALHAANQEAKKFAHVNQKALDQYVSFSEQREELARRKQENDAAEEKIRHLIETLDMRKDEAIERTFKQVALTLDKSLRLLFLVEKVNWSCRKQFKRWMMRQTRVEAPWTDTLASRSRYPLALEMSCQ
eukprot:jgi/Picre1/34828/NNA_002294.t1